MQDEIGSIDLIGYVDFQFLLFDVEELEKICFFGGIAIQVAERPQW
jgi:hypothetical protein